MNNYQPRAPHPRRHAAEPRHTSRLGNVTQQAGGPRRTPYLRVDQFRDLPSVGADPAVQPPGPHLGADFLQGFLADRGQERGNLPPAPPPCPPWPEREPEERERRVLFR